MNSRTSATFLFACLALAAVGCGGTPNKAALEKKVKDGLAKASPQWKDVTYETRANDTVSAVGANRTVDGKTYWFSFTGSEGNGGVAVRGPGGEWLCKYRYDKATEVSAEKDGRRQGRGHREVPSARSRVCDRVHRGDFVRAAGLWEVTATFIPSFGRLLRI
jgi:hypothetical protein